MATATVALTCLAPGAVRAQSLEPRAYSNAPVGTNFLLAGVAYSQGDVTLDPSLPIADLQAKVYSGFLGYARTLRLWGQSGQIAVVVPAARVDANALVEGQDTTVSRTGVGDPAVRLTANLYGAPALSPEAFAGYRQDTIVGVSLLVTAPWGQYFPNRLINIGSNRWSVRPEVGVSKALDKWVIEGAASATFFTANHALYPGSSTREQDPLYALQAHVIYNFGPGMWAGLGTTYYTGGRTTVNGIIKNDLQQSSRWGGTLALPVDRNKSIKVFFTSGVFTRTGTDFTTVGVAWQYRWGDRR